MTEYTPSAHVARERYWLATVNDTNFPGADGYANDKRAEFDRWLAAHDAKLRAEVERLRGVERGWQYDRAEWERERDEARQQLADLRAGIEALATEGEAWGRGVAVELSKRLRALLAGSGEQPGECPECGDAMCRCGIDWTAPVVPDSADVREGEGDPPHLAHEWAALSTQQRAEVFAWFTRPLAAVGQDVTARRPGCCQGWEWTPSGVVDALSGVERFDQEPCKHNHSAVVRPTGQEGS